MKITLGVALAALLFASGHAEAQTYFSRTKLQGFKKSATTTTPAPSPTPTYTYEPNYGAYSACSGGQQYRPLTNCRRSDGQYVSTNQCIAAGHPGAIYNDCVTYTPEVWGYSACNIDASHPNQRIRYQGCRGSDGNPYHAANCGLVEEEWISC